MTLTLTEALAAADRELNPHIQAMIERTAKIVARKDLDPEEAKRIGEHNAHELVRLRETVHGLIREQYGQHQTPTQPQTQGQDRDPTLTEH